LQTASKHLFQVSDAEYVKTLQVAGKECWGLLFCFGNNNARLFFSTYIDYRGREGIYIFLKKVLGNQNNKTNIPIKE
jgi:hypothetical protein